MSGNIMGDCSAVMNNLESLTMINMKLKNLLLIISIILLTACGQTVAPDNQKSGTSPKPPEAMEKEQEAMMKDETMESADSDDSMERVEEGNEEIESMTKEEGESMQKVSAQVFTLSAKHYDYTPSEIRVKAGQPVTIKIDNTDFTHGINIPSLGLRDDNEVTFTPTEAGTIEFKCANPCGSGHRDMTGTIIVE